MTSKRTETSDGRVWYRFRLRSLFLLTTVVGLFNGLAHYVGGWELLRQVLFILFTIFMLLFVFIGPLLVTEFLTFLIDTAFGLSTKSKLPGRRRFE